MAHCRDEEFLEVHQFYTFFVKITLHLGMGVMKFTKSCLITLQIQITVKIGPVVLEKNMLTDDARRTTEDNGRQVIAIGHLFLSYSLPLWEKLNLQGYIYISYMYLSKNVEKIASLK